MDAVALKTALDMLVSYGVPLVITGGVLWLLWRYVPKWIDANIDSQTKVPQELSKLNDTLRVGLERMTEVGGDLDTLKVAVRHAAGAAEKVLTAYIHETKPDQGALLDLQRMREAIDKGEHTH